MSDANSKDLDQTTHESPVRPMRWPGRVELSLDQLLVWLVIVFVGLRLGGHALYETDVWSHVKLGDWIIEHRSLPVTEPLSSITERQEPMLHYGWLTQVIYALLFRLGRSLAGGDWFQQVAGGADMLCFFHQAAMIAMFAALALAYRRMGSSLRVAALATLFVAVSLATWNIIDVQRPQAMGMLCFALFLVLIAEPMSTRTALIWLPGLTVLWANLHGSFAMGFVVLASAILGRLVETAWRGRPVSKAIWTDSYLRRLLAAAVVSSLAVMILNPHGPRIFWLVATFGQNPNLASIVEWLPIRFNSAFTEPLRAYAALIVAAALTLVLSPRWFTPTQWLLILGFGVGPLVQVRLLTWTTLVVVAVLVPHWVAIGDKLANRWKWIHLANRRDMRYTSVALFLGAILLAYSIPGQWIVRRKPRAINDSVTWSTPWRATAEIAGLRDSPIPLLKLRGELQRLFPDGKLVGPIFCSENKGDFLYWAQIPGSAPSLFSQIHLIRPAYWTVQHNAVSGIDWRAEVDRIRANLIIVDGRRIKLIEQVRGDAEWLVVQDETADPEFRGRASQTFVALRKKPMMPDAP